MFRRIPLLSMLFATLGLLGAACADSEDASTAGGASGSPGAGTSGGGSGGGDADAGDAGDSDAGQGVDLAGRNAAVVSDWMQKRLSFVDVGALQDGATRQDALLAELDLSDYAEGAINAEVTPDGSLALVSVSSGFFSIPLSGAIIGAGALPTGPGTLLFVDLRTQTIVDELDTGAGPMGIAWLDGGARALVAHFNTNALSVVDVAERSVVEEIEIGPFSEELAVDDTGTVGIVAYSAAGNVRTFATDDVAGTLSPDIELTGDSVGVAFFPGTKIAYVVQAPNALLGASGGRTIVDVTDPSAPVVLEDVRDDAAPVAYPTAAVPERDSVVVPIVRDSMLVLEEIQLSAENTAEVVQTLELGPSTTVLGAYGATVDTEGRVLLSVPSQNLVIVVDLELGESFSVAWDGDGAGPMDIALIP